MATKHFYDEDDLEIPFLPATEPPPTRRPEKMWRKFDAGANHRPKGAPKDDCTVRALTTAQGIPYQDAWTLLYAMQGEMQRTGFALIESLKASDPRLGVVRMLNFPAVKGKPRMTGAVFCRKHPKGRFILSMANHVAAVRDGELFDSWDSTAKCVYTAWEIEAAS